MRYEYNQWPVHRYDKLAGFDPTSGAYLWAGVNPLTGEGPNVRRQVRDPDFNNFAPRIGLAYLVTPKTTFRLGYGIFYVANQLWEQQGTRGNWPYAISETISGRNTPETLPADLRYIGAFMPTYIEPVPGVPPDSQHVLGRLDRTGYAQQWNASVQRELARDLLFEVNYVGSRGVKQSIFTNINTPQPGPGVVGSPQHPRPFNQYGAMSLMTNISSSTYHSLQIKAEKRFSNGLQFLSSYAWGKHIDIGGSCFSCSASPQNPYDPAADRALGNFDFRHVWTHSWFYQLPFGQGRKFLSGATGVLNQFVGGWEITGITRYNTGGPINVFMSEDIANIGPRSLAQRPDRVGPSTRNINPNDKTQGWLNASAFRTPAPFNFGNLGRNTEKGPGFGNWDLGIFKNFPIQGETRMLQFRAELFNAFNHPNLGNYDSRFCEPIATCNPNFGRIFSMQNASREIQFALKFLF
jgi:hypothetical protein